MGVAGELTGLFLCCRMLNVFNNTFNPSGQTNTCSCFIGACQVALFQLPGLAFKRSAKSGVVFTFGCGLQLTGATVPLIGAWDSFQCLMLQPRHCAFVALECVASMLSCAPMWSARSLHPV